MCIDICYATSVDYTTIQVPAGESQLFIMDFFTDPVTGGTGMAQIGFRNIDASNNKFTSRMYSSTIIASGVLPEPGQDNTVSVFLQPAQEQAMIKLPEEWLNSNTAILLLLYDINGRKVLQMPVNEPVVTLVRGDMQAGIYHFQLASGGSNLGFWKVFFY